MLHKGSLHSDGEQSARLDPVELFFLCAADREDAAAWSEFLRRYTWKIKYFIRGTLHKTVCTFSDPDGATVPGGIQESDFLQNTILRLVEKDCAVMKRFSGTSEDELLAYLAVIARSVVMDTLRRHRVFKSAAAGASMRNGVAKAANPDPDRIAVDSKSEREILGRELTSLTQRSMRSLSGPALARDQLVFQLYFSHGLSFRQIAECKGINLSKAGVEKLLNRLVDRVRTLASAAKPEASHDEKR
ncbi:MAG: sigma-70 family RNA polymerase sigma factor [Acidobacteriia bacterium]|nr:sigma-70 family RNA polymerase sigma factor [Terriglobia bacterium]